MPSRYLIAGLQAASDFPLPALSGDQRTAADVVFETSGVRQPDLPDPSYSGPGWAASETAWQIDTPEGARLRQWDGRLSLWAADAPLAASYPWMMGVGFALALYRRGDIPLHASAIAFEDEAVLLMGDSGAGKSTLAAALVAAGGRLLADDIVCPRPDGHGGFEVDPVFLSLRLSPQAARHFGWGGEPTERDKIAAVVPQVADARARRVKAIYVLRTRRAEGWIAPMARAPALGELAKNVFSRSAAGAAGRAQTAANRARELALAIPVREAATPEGLGLLGAFAEHVRDCA